MLDRPSADSVNSTTQGVGYESRFKFCEDLESIPGLPVGEETVLISCDANRGGWNTVMGPLKNPGPRGTLFTYQYPTTPQQGRERAKANEVKLINFPDETEFHPLGLSVFEPNHETSQMGEGRRLFVVNHRKHRSSIEVFDLFLQAEERQWEAHWRRSIVHPLATHTPNSIHALTPTSFVVTTITSLLVVPVHSSRTPYLCFTRRCPCLSFHLRSQSGWLRYSEVLTRAKVAAALAQVETLLGLPLGWVSYVEFDEGEAEEQEEGVRVQVLAKGIPFANGLVVTPDQKTVVVASTTFPGVFIYSTTSGSGSSSFKAKLDWRSKLTLQTKLHLPFRVDNLAFSHPSPSPSSPSSKDAFNGLTLLATGHPSPLSSSRWPGSIHQNKSKLECRHHPHKNSFTSSSFSKGGENPYEAGEEWEDKDAPLPAHHFTLSHNGAFHIRTLLQTRGNWIQSNHQTKTSEWQVALAPSTTPTLPKMKGRRRRAGGAEGHNVGLGSLWRSCSLHQRRHLNEYRLWLSPKCQRSRHEAQKETAGNVRERTKGFVYGNPLLQRIKSENEIKAR